MTTEFNSKVYNPIDYYLIINTETGKTYETFRIKSAAKKFILDHTLNDILELKVNPKYIK